MRVIIYLVLTFSTASFAAQNYDRDDVSEYIFFDDIKTDNELDDLHKRLDEIERAMFVSVHPQLQAIRLKLRKTIENRIIDRCKFLLKQKEGR